MLAFHHTKPVWEFHLVVIPKRHIASLTRASAADQDDIAAILKVAQFLARTVEEERGDQAVVTNSAATRTPGTCACMSIQGSAAISPEPTAVVVAFDRSA